MDRHPVPGDAAWAAAGSRTRRAVAVLVAADLCAFLVCAAVAHALRVAILGAVPPPRVTMAAAPVWLVLRCLAGLYPGYGLWPPEELRRQTLTTVAAAVVHASLLFALQWLDASRLAMLLTWVLLLPAARLARAAAKQVLVHRGLYGWPVVVLGAGPAGRRLVRELRADPSLGYVPAAVFDDDPRLHGTQVEGVPVVGSLRDALADRVPAGVAHAVVAVPGMGREELLDLLQGLAARYRRVGVVADLVGQASLCVQPVPVGRSLVLELQNNLANPTARAAKRAFDVAVSLLLAPLALPVVALAALAVKLASPGPAFYAQWREGQGGRPIRVWKIRTMWPDAEERLERYLEANPAAREEWLRRFKLKDDPRVIPRVGSFLRRWSLDELPQLWNVLRGEMSLVGPRAFPDYHLARFPEEFRQLRRQVPPGITGLWQVSTRAEGDLADQMDADAYYIRNWSLWLDLWILFRTLVAVVRGRGAY